MKGISDVLVAGGFGSVQLKNSSDNYVSHVRSRGGDESQDTKNGQVTIGRCAQKKTP